MRPAASRRRFVLDEEATVDRIAEQEIWVPVMKPEPVRRFDLAVVVEEGPAMVLWRPTIGRLRRLLEGAFRDVRTWRLGPDPDRAGRVVVTSGRSFGAERGLIPESLITPGNERLILIVGDGVSQAWRDGSIFTALKTWGQHHPTAILQLLPPRLWPGTGMDLPMLEIRSPRAGVANTRLEVDDPSSRRRRSRRRRRRDRPIPMPVPVAWLEPESVARSALLVAGPEGSRAPGLVLPDGPPPEPRATRPAADPVRLVRYFRAAASPPARQLAGYLAAVPLSLPVMRRVQWAMIPESRPEHLAEVFLGGLLRCTSPVRDDLSDNDLRYDFLPGVRELLISDLPIEEELQVLKVVSSNSRPTVFPRKRRLF